MDMDFEDYLQTMEHLSLAPSVKGTNKVANTKFQDISEETQKWIVEQLGTFSTPALDPGFGRGHSPGHRIQDPEHPQDTGPHPQDYTAPGSSGLYTHPSPVIHPGVRIQETFAPPAWLTGDPLPPLQPLDPTAVTSPYQRSQDDRGITGQRSLISHPPGSTEGVTHTEGELIPQEETGVSCPPPARCAGSQPPSWDPATTGPNCLQRNEPDGAFLPQEDMIMG